MMKLADWYELTLWGIDIPLPPEYEGVILKFRAVEDSNFHNYEIVYITGISLYHAKVLKKQYSKTMNQKREWGIKC